VEENVPQICYAPYIYNVKQSKILIKIITLAPHMALLTDNYILIQNPHGQFPDFKHILYDL